MNLWIALSILIGTTWGAPGVEVAVELSPIGGFIAKAPAPSVSGQVLLKSGVLEARSLRLPANALVTGISLRDQHLRTKVLEAQSFPILEITGLRGQGGKFRASLKIKKAVHAIDGTYSLQGRTVRSEFKILLSDFGIEAPSYLGVSVEDSLDIRAELPLAATQ